MDILDQTTLLSHIVDNLDNVKKISELQGTLKTNFKSIVRFYALSLVIHDTTINSQARTIYNNGFSEEQIRKALQPTTNLLSENKSCLFNSSSASFDVSKYFQPKRMDSRVIAYLSTNRNVENIHTNGSLVFCALWHLDQKIRRQDLEIITLLNCILYRVVIRLIENEKYTGCDIILTHREKEILRLVANGNSTAEIAMILKISFWTVKSHVTNLMRKLSANKRSVAVKNAIEMGLL